MLRLKRLLILLTSIVVLAAVTGGVWWWSQRKGNVVKDTGDVSEYSAVFVNNNIYFGKITYLDDKEMILEEVYNYTVITPASPSPSANTSQPTLFDATKVGVAPGKRYRINRDQIILWYSLNKDADVVKTIEDYKSGRVKPQGEEE